MTKDNDDGKGDNSPSRQNKQSDQSYAKAVQQVMTKPAVKGKTGGKDISPPKFHTQEMEKSGVLLTPTGKRSIVQNYKIVKSSTTKGRLEDHMDLVKIVAAVMAVYMTHDQGHNQASCNLWNNWSMKGITNPDNDIHTVAEIVNYPKNKYRSVKSIGKYMLEQIPILAKYMSFVRQSKDVSPLCFHSTPRVVSLEYDHIAESSFKLQKNKDTTEKKNELTRISTPKGNKKNEAKIDEELTPIATNRFSGKETTITPNPFASLGDDSESIAQISSIEEITDDGSLSDVERITVSTPGKDDLEKISDEDSSSASILKDLKSVEISFDKQYDDMVGSLTTHDEIEIDKSTFTPIQGVTTKEMEGFWKTKSIEMMNEVQTFIAKDQQANQEPRADLSMASINEYWKIKEKEFDEKTSERLESITTLQELTRIETENMRSTIKREMTSQNETMRDMINNTIENYSRTNTQFGVNMEQKCSDLFQTMSEQSERKHRLRQEQVVSQWEQMRNKMAEGHTKLVATNKVVLKNNEILKNKLRKAEKVISTQMIEIENQTAAVTRLTSTMDDIEERYDKLETKRSPEYVTTLFEDLFSDIKDKISEKFEEKCNELVGTMVDKKIKGLQSNVKNNEQVRPESVNSENGSQEPYHQESRMPTFMGAYDIQTGKDSHPILTPFQFLHPKRNHHPREVESHKFNKATLSVKCTSEDNIFTFYNTLRHIAGNFNILLLPLTEITKEKGVCQITAENCINFESARDAMSTALHLKLTTNDYFKGFPQAKTYVQAAANNADGFKLLYRIVEIIHPQLRASKGGIHKSIEPPSYNDVNDDSIYTLLNRYKNYLLYELLSPETRKYNKREQATYIINSLKDDERFSPGVEYVRSTLQAYQRDCRTNPSVTFPIDLEIDEIGVTIDERSTKYTVGEEGNTEHVNTFAHGSIRAMNDRSRFKQNEHPKYKSTDKPKDNKKQIICKACAGVGHCITNTDTLCYNLAKVHLCTNFISKESNMSLVKTNTYKYRKERKERLQKSRISSTFKSFIKKMGNDDNTEQELNSFINLAQALDHDDKASDSDELSEQSTTDK